MISPFRSARSASHPRMPLRQDTLGAALPLPLPVYRRQRSDIVKTCDRQVTGYLTRGGVFLPPTPLSTAVQGDAAHAMASL